MEEENFLLALDKPSMYKLPSSPVTGWQWTCRKPVGRGRKKRVKV